MKLLIQIPCFNEEDNIGALLESMPKKIKGIDKIKILILDDFSSDKTCEIAKKFPNVEILKSQKHLGLAKNFKRGFDWAIKENFDIVVNIDGDNQYFASDIEKLIQPILKENYDIVIGTRPIQNINTFSPIKKILQKFGSFMVKMISNTDIIDAPSGFRAFSKEAILKINIFNNFTHTIECIIQAKSKNLTIKNIDINVNPQKNRNSRLFKSNFDYIIKQSITLIRFFIIYRAKYFFNILALNFLFIGSIIGFRFLYFYLTSDGKGHIQSLILCAIILILSFICFMLAVVGDLLSINRKLLEDIQYEIRLNKHKK